MSLLDTASLIVTPNGYKEGKLYSVIPSDGSGDLSVTRATTATRVNSAGLVELVPYNLNSYSENFTLSWGTDGTSTATNNFTTAPNGTQTAAKVVANFVNGYAYKSLPVAVGTYTLSFYVKASAPTTISIDFNDVGTGIFGQVFNLTTEWQRISFTHNVTGGSNLYITYSSLQLGVEYYIWGAQLVEGSVAKDYQKTETRLNIPRLDYSNGTCPSILVEPQRTNLALWSSSFDNAAWSKFGSTSVTPNTSISPDGSTNADTVITSGSDVIRQTLSLSLNTVYTYSIFVKKTNYDLFGFQNLVNGSGVKSIFNLSTGVVQTQGSGHTASIINYGNGWYRCIITFNTGVSSSNIFDLSADGVTTTLRTFYCYGAMSEAGSYATSYIPTTSASVTRNADVISKTGISSLIGQTEGTLFVDFIPTERNNARYISIEAASGVGSGWIGIFSDSLSPFKFRFYGDGFDFYSINGIQLNERYKVALSYKNGVLTSAYVNGINQGTLTANTTSKSYANFKIGTAQIGNRGDGEYNAVCVWPIALSDNQLATLTTI